MAANNPGKPHYETFRDQWNKVKTSAIGREDYTSLHKSMMDFLDKEYGVNQTSPMFKNAVYGDMETYGIDPFAAVYEAGTYEPATGAVKTWYADPSKSTIDGLDRTVSPYSAKAIAERDALSLKAGGPTLTETIQQSQLRQEDLARNFLGDLSGKNVVIQNLNFEATRLQESMAPAQFRSWADDSNLQTKNKRASSADRLYPTGVDYKKAVNKAYIVGRNKSSKPGDYIDAWANVFDQYEKKFVEGGAKSITRVSDQLDLSRSAFAVLQKTGHMKATGEVMAGANIEGLSRALLGVDELHRAVTDSFQQAAVSGILYELGRRARDGLPMTEEQIGAIRRLDVMRQQASLSATARNFVDVFEGQERYKIASEAGDPNALQHLERARTDMSYRAGSLALEELDEATGQYKNVEIPLSYRDRPTGLHNFAQTPEDYRDFLKETNRNNPSVGRQDYDAAYNAANEHVFKPYKDLLGQGRTREEALAEVMGGAKEKLSATLENPGLYTRGLDAGSDLLRDSKKAAMSTLTAAHGNSFGKFLKANWLPIAGATAAVAFVGNLFSASDDEYNTIEGLKHAGFAGATRKLNTDFGSGWRGLEGIADDILRRTDRGYQDFKTLEAIGNAHLEQMPRFRQIRSEADEGYRIISDALDRSFNASETGKAKLGEIRTSLFKDTPEGYLSEYQKRDLNADITADVEQIDRFHGGVEAVAAHPIKTIDNLDQVLYGRELDNIQKAIDERVKWGGALSADGDSVSQRFKTKGEEWTRRGNLSPEDASVSLSGVYHYTFNGGRTPLFDPELVKRAASEANEVESLVSKKIANRSGQASKTRADAAKWDEARRAPTPSAEERQMELDRIAAEKDAKRKEQELQQKLREEERAKAEAERTRVHNERKAAEEEKRRAEAQAENQKLRAEKEENFKFAQEDLAEAEDLYNAIKNNPKKDHRLKGLSKSELKEALEGLEEDLPSLRDKASSLKKEFDSIPPHDPSPEPVKLKEFKAPPPIRANQDYAVYAAEQPKPVPKPAQVDLSDGEWGKDTTPKQDHSIKNIIVDQPPEKLVQHNRDTGARGGFWTDEDDIIVAPPAMQPEPVAPIKQAEPPRIEPPPPPPVEPPPPPPVEPPATRHMEPPPVEPPAPEPPKAAPPPPIDFNNSWKGWSEPTPPPRAPEPPPKAPPQTPATPVAPEPPAASPSIVEPPSGIDPTSVPPPPPPKAPPPTGGLFGETGGIGKDISKKLKEAQVKEESDMTGLLIGAGVAGGVALGYGAYKLLFSGKDDDYNSIEGLRHGGMAQSNRRSITDFGSGWQGLNNSYSNQLSQMQVYNLYAEDADTVRAQTEDGREISIRLSGIDAPEIAHPGMDNLVGGSQPGAEWATAQLQSMLEGSNGMTLLSNPNDSSYGRVPGVLMSGDRNINLALVQMGAAAALPYGAKGNRLTNTNEFDRAQQEAASSRRGMWADEGWQAVARMQSTSRRKITNTSLQNISRIGENFDTAAALIRMNNPNSDLAQMMAGGGKNDFNIIEGLKHGWHGGTRSDTTDFGSGYVIDKVIPKVKHTHARGLYLRAGQMKANTTVRKMMRKEEIIKHNRG